nr:hypothetical protein [Parabacteroides goldsteinii]
MMKATKQIQTKYSSFTLQLKIISGYVLLLALLSIIVSLVWQEHRKMETLNSGEQLISQKREAVNRTFEKLLDFSFSDDFLLLRDSNKFEEYRMKREVATGALNNLKQHYPSGIQRSQIDKVSSLLQEKETLLLGVMNAISDFSRTDSLLQRRIPVIASQAQTLQQPSATETTEKKGGRFPRTVQKERRKIRLCPSKGETGTTVRLPPDNRKTLFPARRNARTIYGLLEQAGRLFRQSATA